MNTLASITGGTIVGLVVLGVILLGCLGWLAYGVFADLRDPYAFPRALHIAGAVLLAAVTLGGWWWAMAFTTSGDYHAWNEKGGVVEKVSKRLIAGENGMSERYVLQIDGQPFGVDDTRAALVRPGERVSLKCKKDYQWGVPRDAHGWACRWNGTQEGHDAA